MVCRELSRRRFVKVTGTAAAVATMGIEGILSARRAPVYAQGGKLHIVRWVDFIPEADVELKRQAPEASKALGAEVTFEFINANDVFEASAKVAGRWLAMPHAVIGNAVAYRRSWFNEIGAKEFPKTWEEYREVGKKLKAKGKPIGQALGHSFGDPPTFVYPFLWDFGGAEVDASGKKDACDEGGLAWDDTNNNRAFHAGEISATLNGASIYIVAKRQKDKIKDDKGEPLYQDIEHAALMPKGPAGQFALYLPFQHSIMKYSKNQKLAKDFLKWLHQDANYGKWFEVNEGYSVGAAKKWEDHPMWAKVDKPLQVFRQAARLTRAFGHPGPASAKATEAYTKYVIVDMYAKAVQGMKAEDAVKWAEGELKKIYEG